MRRLDHLNQIREILPKGFWLVNTNGHMKVMQPNGMPLRDEKGMPVIVAGSPRSGRGSLNSMSRLKRALRAGS